MTPEGFLVAKANMLSMLRELREFEEGETAAIILLVTGRNGSINYSRTIGIVHTDAAVAALRKLRSKGYLYSVRELDKRYKTYRLTSKGYNALLRITKILENF